MFKFVLTLNDVIEIISILIFIIFIFVVNRGNKKDWFRNNIYIK